MKWPEIMAKCAQVYISNAFSDLRFKILPHAVVSNFTLSAYFAVDYTRAADPNTLILSGYDEKVTSCGFFPCSSINPKLMVLWSICLAMVSSLTLGALEPIYRMARCQKSGLKRPCVTVRQRHGGRAYGAVSLAHQ